MPSTQFETMLAATIDKRSKDIKDQVFDAHPLSKWLMANGREEVWDGSENIETIIEVGKNSTFAARDYKTPITLAEQNPLRTVEIGSRTISGSVTIYQHDIETNRGEGKVINLQKKLIDNAINTAKDELALEMWEDGTGEHLHGFGAIFSRSNTYMGIDRTGTGYAGTGITNNWWWPKMGASYTNSLDGFTYGAFNTAETLAIDSGTDGGIQALYAACCNNGGTDAPDFAVTTLELYNKLRSLVRPDLFRYNEKLAQLGWPDNLQFNNCTFVWDRNCTAAAVYMLNSKYIAFRPYSDYANGFRSTPAQALTSSGLDASAMLMVWRGNLTCEKPQRCGALENKTV